MVYWQWHQWKYELEIKLFLQDNQQNGENFRITLPFGHVAVLLKDQQLIQTLLKSQPDYKYWISKTVDIETNLEKELLEMIHSTGDIYEKHVLQHPFPFYLSIIFQFSRQKLVLR